MKCIVKTASKGYAGGLGTDLMLKDLGLAQENATAVQAATPLGGLPRSLYAAHSLAGNGGWIFLVCWGLGRQRTSG